MIAHINHYIPIIYIYRRLARSRHKVLTVLLLIVFLFCASTLSAKPPELTPKETRSKIGEILKAHVYHQTLTLEIAQRALANYIDELDPAKTYFLEEEIASWLNPSQDVLNKTLKGYQDAEFSSFEALHETFVTTINRRRALEEALDNTPILENVKASEFKDIAWAKSPEELKERLHKIKSLQLKTAEKINVENKEHFFKRLTKRRVSRETELIGQNPKERQQVVLAHVLKATSSALDSQTLYFTPYEADQFMMQIHQRLFGIGAQLRDDLNGLTVVKVIEGSPASRPGKLKVGDKIIAVDGEPIVGMDITEAVSLIRGPEGSSVGLTLLRDNKGSDANAEEKMELELIRGEIVFEESRLETSFEPYADGVIATFHLFSFYQDSRNSSAADLAAAIEKIKKEHSLKGIILDLRENGGGLLTQAVSVAGLFLSKGIIVSIKDNTDQVQHLRNLDNHKLWDGPLIVLTSRASASAAEIVAQTLQDYGRALVVGDAETFGKGTFQTFTLESAQAGKVNPSGEFKVTRGRYYTVSGKSPQLVGVKADLTVPSILSEMEIGEKYAKFPVPTDSISPNFHDDLADIPLIHRYQFEKIYRINTQSILTTYQPFLTTLKQNSSMRIANSKSYQRFIKSLTKEEESAAFADIPQGYDLQLAEASNIMKDLLYLSEKKAG